MDLVSLSFTRYANGNERAVEQFSNTFKHDDDGTYGPLLDKFEQMLRAMGYEIGDRQLMLAKPDDLISDIDPGPFPSNVTPFPGDR